MIPFISLVRDHIENLIARNVYKFPYVKLIEETLDYIYKRKVCVSRYGDGELLVMLGFDIGFQKANNKLQERLIDIIKSNSDNIIITIPDIFVKDRLNLRTRENQLFWKKHLRVHLVHWYKFINKEKIYYNTAISRFYSPMKDKVKSEENAELLKKIWKNKDLLIIEGEYSRLGVGNDLFEMSKSINRVICPSKNAFDFYNTILEKAILYGEEKLILIALGPTATVLAYDLSKFGYWAIDIGHVDMEYLWMKHKVKEKIPLKGRVLNEVVGAQESELEELENNLYMESIVFNVK